MELDTEAIFLFTSENAEASLEVDKHHSSPLSATVSYRLPARDYAGFVIPFRGATEENLSENFLIDFEIKGTPATCRFECKLVTDGGAGVWWVLTPEFTVSNSWQRIQYKRRHFQYAWGASQHFIKGATQVELVLTALEPLQGEFSVRNFSITPIPAGRITRDTAEIKVTSGQDFAPALLDPQSTTTWISDELEEQLIEIRFSSSVELGAVLIHWGSGFASRFDLELKDAGQGWAIADAVRSFSGGVSYHYLANGEGDAIRFRLYERRGDNRYSIDRIEFHPPSFAVTWNDFLARRAERVSPGLYPRYLLGEQSYWTVVAADGSKEKGLINEEGLIELGYGLPSLDAFVEINGKLHTWYDTEQEQCLVNGYFPLPVVQRRAQGFELSMQPWMEELGGRERTFVSYRLKNIGQESLEGNLFIAVRPFQVNPPWQFLNTTGGHSPIHALRFARDEAGNRILSINAKGRLTSLTPVDRFAALNYWQGEVAEFLAQGECREEIDKRYSAEDERGMCSGFFQYALRLEPGEEREVILCCSSSDESGNVPTAYNGAEGYAQTHAFWERRMSAVHFDIAADRELTRAVKAQLGYILANRDGKAIQPGTRCYRRSWIRDGAMTSGALLQFGFFDEVREFIEWFAPYVGEDGAVPCVVDANGVDNTPEHDSHGEFLFLVAEYHRYTKDADLVRRHLPRLMGVVRHITELLDSTMRPDLPPYVRGLLPKSISHEGYAAGPAYSYWDNLWALLGVGRLSAVLADIEARNEASAARELYERLEKVLRGSIAGAMAAHSIDYIPGAADLGDFDATSTTIGVEPANVLQAWFPEALDATFERYWSLFHERLSNFSGDDRYTPYELRVVGTLVRIGRRERAWEALDFFMRHRRPQGWHHWAEVVWGEERHPGFLGDAPHGWVASDFLRSVRSLFAYETDRCWVFGAGVPLDWWRGGIACSFHTPDGLVGLQSVPKTGAGKIEIEVTGPAGVEAELWLPGASSSTRMTLPYRCTVPLNKDALDQAET